MADERTFNEGEMKILRDVQHLLNAVLKSLPSPNYDKCVRALIYTLAGIIATSITITGALIIGMARALAIEEFNARRLYFEIFGDLFVWIVIVIFAGTIAVLLMQSFRFLLNKEGANPRRWAICSAIVILVHLVTVYGATEVAVCGGAALTMDISKDISKNKMIDNELSGIPDWFFWCNSEASDWFAGLDPVTEG